MERKQSKSSEGEIDLLYYLRALKDWMKKLSTLTVNYLHLLWKNLFLLLLIIIVITGAAFSLRYVIPPAYRTNGIFISHFLPAKYYEIMIRDLDQLIREKNLPVVAEQLHISPEVASQIQRIELKPLRDTILERSDTVFAPFEVVVLLNDIHHLDIIQEGMIFYLEGGVQEREMKLAKRRYLEETKTTLSARRKHADSTGSMKIPDSLGLPGHPAFEELRWINKQLDELDRIETVRPFLKRLHYNYPNYRSYLLCGFLLSILLALVVTPIAGKRKLPPR